ncbi:MAG: hypothetical protein L0Z53_09585 [Acidobacteriales bacterium]|nr:hypothetical protein [Terriglobales bacterium]
MDLGLRVGVRWHDADVLHLSVSAWNGAFGGTANVYVNRYGLDEIATKLEGFPRDPRDTRAFELGATRFKEADGGLSVTAYCTDNSGHPCLKLRIVSEYGPNGPVESAQLVLSVEAAAVDQFVEELRQLQSKLDGMATLRAEKR